MTYTLLSVLDVYQETKHLQLLTRMHHDVLQQMDSKEQPRQYV